jgi:hypothetical protein
LLVYLENKVKMFKAGNLAAYVKEWQALTSDPEIMETLTGQRIELFEIPVQSKTLMNVKFTEAQTKLVDHEIEKLLNKGVFVSCTREEGDFVSPIFTRPKKDGTLRMILNLKSLNKFITYYHFKMETIRSAIRSMTPGCYMASIDLKDAYYSVPIHADYHKYLKFQWQGQIYKFVCFPNGLAICPRKFTKLLKPAFAYLRKHGHTSVVFIDDSWLKSAQYNDCIENIVATLSLLDKLGFTVHPEKSILIPTQRIVFLGFVLDSLKMCVSLTPERAQKLIEACQKLLQNACPTIREVAQVLGMMTSSFPGVMFGPLHYRSLDMDKTNALKQSKGNFEGKMSMSQESITEVKWWITSLPEAYNPINHGEVEVTISTDASLTGWGACIDTTTTGGSWTPDERANDINYLEILAVFLALQSFSSAVAGKHVKLLVDNTTAVFSINNMGTCHSKANNTLVAKIWE